MSRITKDIATDVAIALTANKKAEIEKQKDKLSDFITQIYEASLSDLIKQAYKKHKGFIYTNDRIRISGVGLPQGYKYYRLNKTLPQCNSCEVFPVDDNQAKVILTYSNKIEDLQNEYRDLIANIEAALYNLRTYNNVEKEFPEAFKLLPVRNVNTSLMVKLKDIRCKLDTANCS